MTQFKAMKFRVESPEHSEKIQKKLFAMGCYWQHYVGHEIREIIPQNLDACYLFVYENGELGWDDDADYFESEDALEYQEVQLVEIPTYDFIPIPKNTPEKDVVMFDGKEYDKEQFKELLKEALDKL